MVWLSSSLGVSEVRWGRREKRTRQRGDLSNFNTSVRTGPTGTALAWRQIGPPPRKRANAFSALAPPIALLGFMSHRLRCAGVPFTGPWNCCTPAHSLPPLAYCVHRRHHHTLFDFAMRATPLRVPGWHWVPPAEASARLRLPNAAQTHEAECAAEGDTKAWRYSRLALARVILLGPLRLAP